MWKSLKMVQCMGFAHFGDTVRSVLVAANESNRTVLGFSESIKLLSNQPEAAQFCFLAEPQHGDSATHMHEVLLQAFCYENGIHIIKVDCSRKLAKVLGKTKSDESCVLIRKPMPPDQQLECNSVSSSGISNDEDSLISFCEHCWHKCVVKLPESWRHERSLVTLLRFIR